MSNTPIVPGDLFEIVRSGELFMILRRRGPNAWTMLRIGSIRDAEDWDYEEVLLNPSTYRRVA